MNPSVSFHHLDTLPARDTHIRLIERKGLGKGDIYRFRTNCLATLETDRHVIVAETDDDLVGVVGWSNRMIEGLFVHPDHQGRDIGTRLVMGAMMVALSRNTPLIGVSSATSSSFGFYRKMGFHLPAGAESQNFAELRV